MVIGLIGKVGSGKSAALEYIKEQYGAIVYICDDIAKEMIENKEIDYEYCRPYDFFTNENLQEQCRAKVHPKVFSRINKNISELIDKKNHIIVIETALPGPMLFDMCDKTIYIWNDFDDKTKLLKANRDYNDPQIKLIYESQKYYEKYYNIADYKIENNGTLEELYKKIKEVIDDICITCKQ